jgi:disulfide bond formation protein DsbB
MPLASPRALFLLAFVGCLVLMGAALYLEHVVGLEPCPLCVLQRICVIAFALVCLIAALHGPGRTGRRLYAVLALLFAGAGAATAGRQIWLQGVPADQLPACLPSLDYMMEALPFQEIVRLVLHGSADCAEVNWTLFGMSIPEWSLLGFVAMLAFALLQLLRRG